MSEPTLPLVALLQMNGIFAEALAQMTLAARLMLAKELSPQGAVIFVRPQLKEAMMMASKVCDASAEGEKGGSGSL